MLDSVGKTPLVRPLNVVILTLDSHLAGPAERAEAALAQKIPGLSLSVHAAAEWGENPDALEAAKDAIANGDIILVTLLFLDEHIRAILPSLEARREDCDALIGCIAGSEIVRLTRMGGLDMSQPASGAMALLKKLRGSKKPSGASGAKQMKMLRRLPRILRFIPGKAQDLRGYFLTMQYWLGGSDENIVALVSMLVSRYATGPRAVTGLSVADPVEYPETGLYHPALAARITTDPADLPRPKGARGTVGLLLMRSYVLAGDTAHYDAVIRGLEAQGLAVLPAFAAGLDGRPAIDAFFTGPRGARIDTLLSLTGFSLVGGPAYNDSTAAEEALAALDVPYVSAHALEFQTLGQWQASDGGLGPVEATMLVALPEIDGATNPAIFGGRMGAGGCQGCAHQCRGVPGGKSMQPCPERIGVLAARVAKLVHLHRSDVAQRKVAVVLYGFPPNAGAIGTAAYLSVFESLFNTLHAMADEGYDLTPPDNVAALRDAVLKGNATTHGQEANVLTRIPADDLVAREPHLAEIEAQWGPAPGRAQSDGAGIFVLGAQFGNVLVGVQPAFGYEGDPMRLLFEKGFAPTHAFSAFYRYLREDFGADVALHFGMHGALEFMPGKQVGAGNACWPDRLIGDMPNVYLYAANNPSEASLAKRRSGAVVVSHLTPPLGQAGLYKGLVELKASLERWRAGIPGAAERAELAELIHAQAQAVDLAPNGPGWRDPEAEIGQLWKKILESEEALIPNGFHVVGAPMQPEAMTAQLSAMAGMEGITDAALQRTARLLAVDHETPALLRALSGRFIRPVPGGDLLRSPDILPTGRNMHAFDPFRMPTAFAVQDGARQAAKLLERHQADAGALPRTVAMVLWGSDNIKSDGGPIGQALALLGAVPRFDSFGRLAGAELLPLEVLGRPRIDVVMTLSGIFRDLLPLQTRLLAEAAYLAATAEEPLGQNFVRAHALAYAEKMGVDIETAALRVFSNAEGAYGANVNQLIDSGAWTEEDELADAYEARKGFAYGRSGKPAPQAALLKAALGDVDLAYQNLESVELGVTTVDHYFDTLGGVGRAVKRAKGAAPSVYIGDQTRGDGKVRTLTEQVALETRTRALNPRFFEPLLQHGHEGVRAIEAHVTNTMGWSATTGQVESWVYQRITETFVLDEAMRRRLAELNPAASTRMANRLLEAHERAYWAPDDATLEALRRGAEELEDRLEGVPLPDMAAE
ncbi:magnesium chelatase subunit H [Oceanibium sediminis]|uniref:magnesium chelatase subunit H n=1 Tax=Oceanibium sediminis TaxID=2026339 RepID=UPI000DD45F5C|nr:magnesium chelatase subunit H [Oceanibium sediminis]